MSSLDWAVIAGYFGALLWLSWWVIRRGQDTADDYFLAGRNLGWWIVGPSIFASNPASPGRWSPPSSRKMTADIEQSLVTCAHGPRALRAFLVSE